MDQDTLRFLLREAVRETVTEVLQTVLELDRTAFLQTHGGRRNGYYPRRLETTFGQVDLKVPRDREGQYYPAFLKPYARRLVDVGEVAVALYAAGVSQRKAAEVIPFYANAFVLGHQWNRVCRLRVSGAFSRTRHRSATTSIISSRSRKYRLATTSFTRGHTRSTGWSSGE
jgi:transposase-like protein